MGRFLKLASVLIALSVTAVAAILTIGFLRGRLKDSSVIRTEILQQLSIPAEMFPSQALYLPMESDGVAYPAVEAKSQTIYRPESPGVDALALLITRRYRSTDEASNQWLSWIKSHPLDDAVGMSVTYTHSDSNWAACGQSYDYSCAYIAQYGTIIVGYFQVMSDEMSYPEFRSIVELIDERAMRLTAE